MLWERHLRSVIEFLQRQQNPCGTPERDFHYCRSIIAPLPGVYEANVEQVHGRHYLVIRDTEAGRNFGGRELIRRDQVEAVRELLAPDADFSDTLPEPANDTRIRHAFDAVRHHPVTAAVATIAVIAVAAAFQNSGKIEGALAGLFGGQ